MTIELSAARIAPIQSVETVNEFGERQQTPIPGEHALTVYLNKRELVTLMTLGQAPEAMVLGYLRNQRLVRALDEVASIQVDWSVNAAAVSTHEPVAAIEERTARTVVTTGCGQGTMFGDLMDEVDTLRLSGSARLTQKALYAIVETIRFFPSVYRQAGSVHGCGLFRTDGDRALMDLFFEDVGRHNAVDTIAGQMWLDAIDGADKVFYTTGRLTSEMVIKCAQMGVPILLSRSGVTRMGHAVAAQVGITLIGRCTGKHFLVFTGHERFVANAPQRRTAGLHAAPG